MFICQIKLCIQVLPWLIPCHAPCVRVHPLFSSRISKICWRTPAIAGREVELLASDVFHPLTICPLGLLPHFNPASSGPKTAGTARSGSVASAEFKMTTHGEHIHIALAQRIVIYCNGLAMDLRSTFEDPRNGGLTNHGWSSKWDLSFPGLGPDGVGPYTTHQAMMIIGWFVISLTHIVHWIIQWSLSIQWSPTKTWILPSGNGWHSYWKWPFIVDFPIKNGDFP